MSELSVCALSPNLSLQRLAKKGNQIALVTEVERPQPLSPYPRTSQAQLVKVCNALDLSAPHPSQPWSDPHFDGSAIPEPQGQRRMGVQGTVLTFLGPEISWGCSSGGQGTEVCAPASGFSGGTRPSRLWPAPGRCPPSPGVDEYLNQRREEQDHAGAAEGGPTLLLLLH